MALVFLVSIGIGYFGSQTPAAEEQEQVLEPKPPDNRTWEEYEYIDTSINDVMSVQYIRGGHRANLYS